MTIPDPFLLLTNQITQIIQSYLFRYVNTGDKVIDNGLILVINTFLSIVVIMLMNLVWFDMPTYIRDKNKDKYTDEIIVNLISKRLFDVKSIQALKYNCTLDGNTSSLLDKWIMKNVLKDNILCEKSLEVKLNGEMLNKQLEKVTCPTIRYNHNKTYHIVWLCEGKLYCDCVEGLQRLNVLLIGEPKEINREKVLSTVKPTERQERDKSLFQITQDYSSTPKDTGAIISKNKTFDNIYIQDKELLLKTIEKFETRTLYPAGLNLDNKLGILLYGAPGTGKTGCIKALANRLNRDLLTIDASVFVEKDENALNRLISGYINTSIIVLDEFDHILTDIFDANDTITLETADSSKTKKGPTKFKKANEEMKLLKFLDGIADTDGRIIIATTNNPDRINPAFLRPGRFDIKLKLGFCTIDMFRSITKTKYPDTGAQLVEDNYARITENILPKNITPLVLINCLITTDTFEELLDRLEMEDTSIYGKTIQKSVYVNEKEVNEKETK